MDCSPTCHPLLRLLLPSPAPPQCGWCTNNLVDSIDQRLKRKKERKKERKGNRDRARDRQSKRSKKSKKRKHKIRSPHLPNRDGSIRKPWRADPVWIETQKQLKAWRIIHRDECRQCQHRGPPLSPANPPPYPTGAGRSLPDALKTSFE